MYDVATCVCNFHTVLPTFLPTYIPAYMFYVPTYLRKDQTEWPTYPLIYNYLLLPTSFHPTCLPTRTLLVPTTQLLTCTYLPPSYLAPYILNSTTIYLPFHTDVPTYLLSPFLPTYLLTRWPVLSHPFNYLPTNQPTRWELPTHFTYTSLPTTYLSTL